MARDHWLREDFTKVRFESPPGMSERSRLLTVQIDSGNVSFPDFHNLRPRKWEGHVWVMIVGAPNVSKSAHRSGSVKVFRCGPWRDGDGWGCVGPR